MMATSAYYLLVTDTGAVALDQANGKSTGNAAAAYHADLTAYSDVLTGC